MKPISLGDLVSDFALALKAVDSERPQENPKFKEGVGPLKEKTAVDCAFGVLKESKPNLYSSALPCRYPGTKGQCDIVIPGAWAIEFKLVRPFGDNGKEDEHWLKNLLYPYQGNVSAISDGLKLRSSEFEARKAVVVIVFEQTPPKIDILRVIQAFELIASDVVGLRLSAREHAFATGLIHPVHQQLQIFGWEVL